MLKSDIYDDLLSRALVKSWQLHAYVDIKSNCLIINTSSAKKAELVTIMLRKALGSLKVALPGIAGTDMSELSSPVELMLTKWLKTNNYPKDLVIGQKCVLQSVDDKAGVIRCQNQDLFRSEIKQFIENDTFVSALTLTWEEKITFSLTKEYIFKGLRYLEFVQDQVNDIHTESDMEKFDADFSVMSLLLTEFLARMKSIFSAQNAQVDEGEKENSVVI